MCRRAGGIFRFRSAPAYIPCRSGKSCRPRSGWRICRSEHRGSLRLRGRPADCQSRIRHLRARRSGPGRLRIAESRRGLGVVHLLRFLPSWYRRIPLPRGAFRMFQSVYSWCRLLSAGESVSPVRIGLRGPDVCACGGARCRLLPLLLFYHRFFPLAIIFLHFHALGGSVFLTEHGVTALCRGFFGMNRDLRVSGKDCSASCAAFCRPLRTGPARLLPPADNFARKRLTAAGNITIMIMLYLNLLRGGV